MKKSGPDECSYEEMHHGIGGQSIEQPYHYDDARPNEYENSRKSFYGPNGFDWSDMRSER